MKNSKKEEIWRIIPFEVNDAYYNMAADEAIFRCFSKHQVRTIRFYGWNPSTVSIGQNQKLSEEVDLELVEKFNFQVVRRISGGGAVFHDSQGELTYSIVTSFDYLDSKAIDDSYYEIVNLITKPLEDLGISINTGRIHCPSVFSMDKKISGNAQARTGDIILQHGTILINFDADLMYSVLKARPGKSHSDMVASVYQKITSISEEIEEDFTPHSLAEYYIQYLTSKDPNLFKISSYFEDERIAINQLITSKYKSKIWLNSR